MAIQISEMEKYKYICSEKKGSDVGKMAYMEWSKIYACKVRRWLETKNIQEIDALFDKVSDPIKRCIYYKTRKSH